MKRFLIEAEPVFLRIACAALLSQVKVHVDLAKRVDEITLKGLKADCLPFSGVGRIMMHITRLA